MKVGISGEKSTIVREFRHIMAENGHPVWAIHALANMPLNLPAYLICTGYLAGERIEELSDEQAALTWQRNFVEIARFCDLLFDVNDIARVVVMGSESGFSGSYDMAYAGAKAALHRYVETKRLDHPDQMLVALAPHVIWDSGMTERHKNLLDLEQRGKQTRLGRWLTPREVALEAAHLLFDASTALSGQVIRMRAS